MNSFIEELIQLFVYPDCLFCHQKREPDTSWTSLIYGDHAVLCHTCQGKLEFLEGELCEKCSRPLGKLEPAYRKGSICYDCWRWEEDLEWQGLLQRNHSLYFYNDFLKEVIAQYKFRGDYVLAQIFQRDFKQKIKKLKPDFLIPIPLSKIRLQERGFNQVEAILQEAGLTFESPLERHHSEKQSKKQRDERFAQSNPFRWNSEISVEGKQVLILDDIYTTGSTIRHAAKILKDHGAREVQSLTIAR
ncbi:comF operon protein ComFC [Bacillus carboniphilus]|uniref:ComF operon protein ComFC n=1 Tax=Bacillus carboniphilus TaxID=86663 RepID=A0ABN0VW55_9BACI